MCMKHINNILRESLLDDDLVRTANNSLIKDWVEKNVKCDGKIMFLKNGTLKFTGDVLIKGINDEIFPEGFIISDVKGDFKIEKCNNLKNINGLFKAYSDVDGDFVVSNCPKIESVAGGPMTVTGSLSFTGNKSLKNLEGMPMFVYETIYIMKNGKRFTEKDIQKHVQVPQRIVCSIEEEVNESVINEALNEPHLLELVKQIKNNNGNVRDYLHMNVELDQLDSSNVKEFARVDTKAIKAASEIVRGNSTDIFGFVILVNHDNEYVAIIDENKFCKPIKKNWVPNGYYRFDGGIISYTECMNSIKNSYSIIVVKWDFMMRNNFYTKRSDRNTSKAGMILNTATQNEEIARANRERYIKLKAQLKAQKDKDFEKIDTEVESVITEVLKISQKAKRNPDKYDSYQVKRLNARIYGEQQWVGFKLSPKTGHTGEDGLLVLYAKFTESYMDISKDGGHSYDRSNLEKLKTQIYDKLDEIKNMLKFFI